MRVVDGSWVRASIGTALLVSAEVPAPCALPRTVRRASRFLMVTAWSAALLGACGGTDNGTGGGGPKGGGGEGSLEVALATAPTETGCLYSRREVARNVTL